MADTKAAMKAGWTDVTTAAAMVVALVASMGSMMVGSRVVTMAQPKADA
jgi:hypothetical protein